MYRFVIAAALACAFAVPAAAQTRAEDSRTRVQVSGHQILINHRPATLFGFRVGSAALSEEWTRELIAQLPLWREHGVNGFTIWLQGTSGGYARLFDARGGISLAPEPLLARTGYGLKEVQARIGEVSGADALHRARRIVRAADRHGMVVVVGFFYRSALGESDTPQRLAEAARAMAVSFRDHGNVIVNVWNETDIQRPLETVENMAAYVRVVKQAAPGRLVCVGSSVPEMNAALAAIAEADLFCQDAGRNYADTVKAFEALAATGKPVINVESYGGNGGGYVDAPAAELNAPEGYALDFRAGWRRVYGAWRDEDYRDGTGRLLMGKRAYLDLIRYVASDTRRQFHLFAHAAGWFQGASRTETADQVGHRRDPGRWINVFGPGHGAADGTPEEPGIRWLLRAFYVARGG
jgi:hypothetical protein